MIINLPEGETILFKLSDNGIPVNLRIRKEVKEGVASIYSPDGRLVITPVGSNHIWIEVKR